MRAVRLARKSLGVAMMIGLLGVLACGPAEQATPTPPPTPTSAVPAGAPTPTPTIYVPPAPVLPTPTATPRPGVTATPTATATPLPVAERPVYGGSVRVPGTVTVFDQLQGGSGYGWGGLGTIGNLWSQLIRVSLKDKVTVEPDLAESWSVSADGTVWKFKIRSGVVDHEGNPYTVEDAYWQMVRYIERPNGLPANRQTCISAYVKKIWDKDKKPVPDGGAEITGPNELTVRLSARKPAFVACLASGWTAFAPAKYLKPIDTAAGGRTRDVSYAKGEVIGTGPFKVKNVELDNFMTLEKFTKYFRPGIPYLDEVQLLTIPDISTIDAAFGIGRLDILGIPPASITVASAKRHEAKLGNTVTFPRVLAMGYNQFNVNLRRAPFGPPDSVGAKNMRFAMQLAMDRQEINDLVFDGIGHISTPYFVGWDWIYTQKEWLEKFSGYDSTPAVKARDLAQAQKLMQEQGYGPTNRLKVELVTSPTGTGNDAAQLVSRQLAKIYMDVAVIGKADIQGARSPTKEQGAFDLVYIGTGAPFADPDAFNTSIFFSWDEGGEHFSGWTNPKWKELFEKQVSLGSDAERAPMLREMAKIVYEDATNLGFIRPTALMGYRTYMKGWAPPLYHSSNFSLENVWIVK